MLSIGGGSYRRDFTFLRCGSFASESSGLDASTRDSPCSSVSLFSTSGSFFITASVLQIEPQQTGASLLAQRVEVLETGRKQPMLIHKQRRIIQYGPARQSSERPYCHNQISITKPDCATQLELGELSYLTHYTRAGRW